MEMNFPLKFQNMVVSEISEHGCLLLKEKIQGLKILYTDIKTQ